jgi:hypothetical protein
MTRSITSLVLGLLFIAFQKAYQRDPVAPQ